MTRRAAAFLLVAVIAQLAGPVLTSSSAAIAEELSAAEVRGKHIYIEGESLGRRVITARLQRTEAPAPASILPCISCHGADGNGSGDDSTVAPLNINWRNLTAPEGHWHEQRAHPAFSEASLARAITNGVDPAGNSLDAAMPRYIIADDDMADLIAYLKRIETQLDPGLSDSRIRLGTILPLEGQLAGVGAAMLKTIEAFFTEVNASGGIHGRTLELVVAGYGANDDPAIWAAHDLLAAGPLFALVSGHLPGYDAELAALAEEEQVPLIGPYTVVPPDIEVNERYSFYLLSGLAQQAEALVEAAVTEIDPNALKLAVVQPLVQSFDSIATAVRKRAAHRGLQSVLTSTYALNNFDGVAVAAKLRDAEVDAVVFLGSDTDLLQLARAAERLGWQPLLLAPGSLAERQIFELPATFSRRILLAYASLPSDYSPAGASEFEQLHADHKFGYEYSVAQIAAYTAAKVLVEGLERTGPGLSRDALLDTLERLDSFDAGLVPPISYGPTRRIGALGAHIVRVDLAASRFDDLTQWIALGGTTDGN